MILLFLLSAEDASFLPKEPEAAALESDMGWCTGVEHGQWDGLLVSYRWPVASYIVHDGHGSCERTFQPNRVYYTGGG